MNTVLVVDDEYAIVEVLELLFEGEGYRVLKAADGFEALAQLRAGGVDVVLTDHMMPRMTGAELCAKMAADEALRDVPVVIMSATFTAASAASTGCAALLKKPFEFDRLLAVVARLLAEKP